MAWIIIACSANLPGLAEFSNKGVSQVIDWNEVNQALNPLKNYEECTQRLCSSLSFAFVRKAYNFDLPTLATYTQQLLGGDARGRYTGYAAWLERIIQDLVKAGMTGVVDLLAKVERRKQLEWFLADYARMPRASKATISNLIGAGYSSLARLANAELQQVSDDFYRYGAAIGKNLKFGNEVESSYRIAKILPVVVKA
jgi:hypothetical protein